MRKLILAAILAIAPSIALAGTITITVAETGQTTITQNYAVADSAIDQIIAAYQQAGNTMVNGNATRAQVLQAWQAALFAQTQSTVQQFNTVPPVVPPPITATPQ